MTHSRILLVDDETSLLTIMKRALSVDGREVTAVETAEKALEYLEKREVDLVISDLKLPGMSGIDLMRTLKEKGSHADFVIITAYATTSSAISALKLGADDYLIKPFDIEELRIVVNRILDNRQIREEVTVLKRELLQDVDDGGLVGRSRSMEQIRRMIQKVGPTELSALITGESGTGKELVAKAIHRNSSRRDGRFVSVNCAALPETLLESELFGAEKGAYTGADRSRKGLFEVADGGTLFLDEIGEMPMSMQSKLLRVLQDFVIRRVGGHEDRPVNVRIVTATNRDLKAEIHNHRFREDLYFRINVFHIDLPPLRNRTEDIPVLAEHLMGKICSRMNRSVPIITRNALAVLERFHWPGNVRELENVMERTLAFETSDVIDVESLPDYLQTDAIAETADLPDRGMDLEQQLRQIRYSYMKKAMKRSGGVMRDAARMLQMTFRSFRYYFHKHEEEFGGANGSVDVTGMDKEGER